MEIPLEKLKELLTGPGHIAEADFESFKKQAEKEGLSLENLLVEKGLISDENLGKVIADALGFPFVDLEPIKIPAELLEIIPEIVAENQEAVMFDQKVEDRELFLRVATPRPENYEFWKLLEKKTGHKVEIHYATLNGVRGALTRYKTDFESQIKKIIKTLEENPGEEERVVQLTDLLLAYAHNNRASDIHLEPLEKHVLVRFRIDGVLHEVVTYSLPLHERVVFRIKILARLRTDEQHASQDGRFTFPQRDGEEPFDVRVSILPVTNGENVVMRLLFKGVQRFTSAELGLGDRDLEKVKRASEKPFGMILAAGPTGSGKTTTLYAVLQILNRPEVNIMTIEDPVEYDIEGVHQTQVNAKKSITFATGLRAIVRQDPDIIMVGEVRDNETAGIAVNAAMTGHLVLSTMHANDAATVFPRLIDMGVEPFLIASGVNVVVAQRLVRKICAQCRTSYSLEGEEVLNPQRDSKLMDYVKKISGKDDISKVLFYRGAGCRICGGTGYSGRTGIFEVMEIQEELRPLIIQKASSDVISKKAEDLGMTTMLYDGVTKVFLGITTLEEVMRATKT